MVILHSDHGIHGINNRYDSEKLLSSNRQKTIFLFKDNKKSEPTDLPKELIELPSMIFDSLGLDNPFIYQRKEYALSESLYPNRFYEIALRTKYHVLFYDYMIL